MPHAAPAETPPEDLGSAEMSENARIVLARRYLKKDEAGEPAEDPEAMFWRVARTVAEEDRKYGASEGAVEQIAREFYRLMTARLFEPNSPTLMNAGRPLGQLSACFVLPVEDALSNGRNGIYDTLRAMALVHQSGGGTGFSFSRLRPSNDIVRSTMGVASGPVSFMSLYDQSTEVVKQGGCVVPDTRVGTDRGVVPIRELGPEDAAPDSWHAHATPLRVATDEEVRESDEFYNHGVAEIRRIRTASGYSLAATLQHRVRVIDASGAYVWRRMDELRVGDRVVLQKGHMLEPDHYRLPGPASTAHLDATSIDVPDEATPELGEFIGYAIGDGAIDRYNRGAATGRLVLTVADAQPDIAEWLIRAGEALFGLRPIPQKKPDDGSTSYFYDSTVLVDWLEQIGVAKPSARDVRAPEIAFRKGAAFARGFLRGLFTADGTVSEDGYPSLSSVSRGLLEDVQALLLAVGVPSAISTVERREGAFGMPPLHRLRVTTQAGLEVFAHDIGTLDDARRARLRARSEAARERNDVIPHRDEALRAGVASPRSLTRSRLVTLADSHEEVRVGPLMWFLAHDQYYDQVTGIEEGESLTLDLSVPGNNTYIANGFVSHNTRRGANMGILRVDHPDIRAFITCKSDVTKITNFNISVAVTDAFMEALKEGEDYYLISPRTGEVVGTENAREVFDMIVEGAWSTGEPGVFFIDRANLDNPVPGIGQYEATNPCGEQVLFPYDVCNLGSINVGAFAITDARAGSGPKDRIDWDGLRRVVHMATHFLDNVIDANKYPLQEIHDLAHRIRRIGLGVMGWADLLVRVGVPYSSEQAVSLARMVMGFINEEARNASEKLAEGRGAFPEWEESIWGPDATCARHPDGSRLRPFKRLRNCNLTTVAPTGTISIIADCSGGIEPLFAVAFMRNQAGALMPDVNQDFVRIARREGWYSAELMRAIAEEGHIHFDEVPEDVQRVFVTAHDVTPVWHIRMQAAFQDHVDAAISKTCNFPEEATREEVREIYQQAYELGCKGVTVYRDGSRPMQVLSTGKTAKEVSGTSAEDDAGRAGLLQDLADARERIHRLEQEREGLEHGLTEEQARTQKRLVKRTRPAALRGITRKMISPLGDIYVTINEDDTGKPFELFATLGKAGGAAMADVEAIGRLISLALRSGIGLTEVHQQLRGISCDRAVGYGPNKVLSVPDAIAQAIELYQQERAGVQQELPISQTITTGAQSAAAQAQVDFGAYDPGETFIGTCPDCASELFFAEGCVKCMVCGYSECG